MNSNKKHIFYYVSCMVLVAVQHGYLDPGNSRHGECQERAERCQASVNFQGLGKMQTMKIHFFVVYAMVVAICATLLVKLEFIIHMK